jgi:F-type H+-transporting ATPase subunit epsilon
MVGRLGFGVMKLKNSGKEERWFVDGGFVQVTRDAVYILTDRLIKPELVDKSGAEEDLRKASEIKPTTPEAAALRERSLAQARAKIRVASGA